MSVTSVFRRMAVELGIGLFEVTELIRRYMDHFDWDTVPLGKLNIT